jgi:hypothetical protein
VRVLFFMRSTVYVRNFESTLRLLAERGHHVHVAAHPHHELDPTDLIGRLCREYPSITHGTPPPPLDTRWARRGYELRRGLDYLRYLEPEYHDAPKLRRRAEQKSPGFLASRLLRSASASRAGRSVMVPLLRAALRVEPVDPQAVAFIRDARPDLVIVTPLVEPGSPQSTYVRAAQHLGIPTALCVYSWDNLTNKGLVHDQLDLVTVWNDAMREEAISLHRIPSERVVVTGAAAYDHWFAWKPATTRDAFCRRVGLDASAPFLLYLCSSKFIAPDELPFVRRWIAGMRAASSLLQRAGVLIRPHPQNVEPWRHAELHDLANVAVWPRSGGNPVDAATRADYYDSIHHSAAVVGINTSAQIESAIVGRGVHTLLVPEFADTQAGTLHFRHLQQVNGGLLHVTSDFAAHVLGLEAAVLDPAASASRGRRFLDGFVRPFGIGEAATPRLVAALERTASLGLARPRRDPWWAPALRPAVALMVSDGRPGSRVKPARVKSRIPQQSSSEVTKL